MEITDILKNIAVLLFDKAVFPFFFMKHFEKVFRCLETKHT